MDFHTNYKVKLTSALSEFMVIYFAESSVIIIQNLLLNGNLFAAEQQFVSIFTCFRDEAFCLFLQQMFAEKAFRKQVQIQAQSLGLSKLNTRKTSLCTSSGNRISFKFWYAERAGKDYDGERNLFHLYFKTVHKSSPLHTSQVCSTAVICPSYEVSATLMTEMCIPTTDDWQRDVTQDFGAKCLPNRAKLQLKPGETLANKRVLIAIDGGRCRLREYNGTTNEGKTHECFDTPWCEPKLLVISTLDKNGIANKIDLPLYDAAFGDDETFELLKEYLLALHIHKAAHVQFTGDGAPWIWNRARPFLENLGVAPDKITETLDYYHAAEHLETVIEYIPPALQAKYKPIFKALLWQGDIDAMKTHLKIIFPDLEDKPLKPFMYFEKNACRMKYAIYRKRKLVCGSGIIESGIRRIINLRFKCPSAFWIKDKLQSVIFLRAVFLAGRWPYLQNNFYNP